MHHGEVIVIISLVFAGLVEYMCIGSIPGEPGVAGLIHKKNSRCHLPVKGDKNP
jgi:hypothetical protein